MSVTAVFSSKAEMYAKYRWDYAPQAIQAILDVTQISNESSIADIGAGTGILTKHFVDKVKDVFAIEPNLEMRQMARKELEPYPSCHVIDGCAEATTLPDHSIDLITVAQAIHWFEPEPTKVEFLRILEPDGWLAVLRNYGTDDELNEAIAGILIEENGVDTSHAAKLPARKPMCFFYGNDEFLRLTFSFAVQLTWEGFIGSLSSASYAPDEGSPLYANFERAARKVFDRFSSDGRLCLQGVTELYLGQIATYG